MQSIPLSVTLVLVGLTCFVSWLAWQKRAVMDALILWSPAVSRHGQWYRLLSYGFVHADVMHLLFNMITLFFFGSLVERAFAPLLGPAGFTGFYLGGLLVSILPSWLRHRDDPQYRSLGASGAVSAVLFASVLLAPWNLIYVFFVPMPAIVFALLYVGYSIWMERRGGDNVNHSAHLWGAGYGLLFFLLLEPRLLGHFLARLMDPWAA